MPLALVYGVKKFHKYLCGRQFTMMTDHKPLLLILSVKAAVPFIAAARMQRWGARCQHTSIRLSTKIAKLMLMLIAYL